MLLGWKMGTERREGPTWKFRLSGHGFSISLDSGLSSIGFPAFLIVLMEFGKKLKFSMPGRWVFMRHSGIRDFLALDFPGCSLLCVPYCPSELGF